MYDAVQRGQLYQYEVWGEFMQLPQEEQQTYCQENFPSAWRNTESGDWEIAFYSENVYHYNLPDIQQRAVGEYLKVNGYPFYRVVDRTDNILDIEVDARDLDALENLIKAL